MVETVALVDLITKGSLLTALAVALIGGMKGWYVWRHTHEKELKDKDSVISDRNETIKKLEKDRDYWRTIALRILTANEKTLAQIVDITQKQGHDGT